MPWALIQHFLHGKQTDANLSEVHIEKGIEQGIEKGFEQGITDTLYSLVDEGSLSIEIAAQKVNKTVDQFRSDMIIYMKDKK